MVTFAQEKFLPEASISLSKYGKHLAEVINLDFYLKSIAGLISARNTVRARVRAKLREITIKTEMVTYCT